MLKTLLAQVKQYKKSSLLTPLFAALEVVMEVLIPFITAMIIDQGIEAGNMKKVGLYYMEVSCWYLQCLVCCLECWRENMGQMHLQDWLVI